MKACELHYCRKMGSGGAVPQFCRAVRCGGDVPVHSAPGWRLDREAVQSGHTAVKPRIGYFATGSC